MSSRKNIRLTIQDRTLAERLRAHVQDRGMPVLQNGAWTMMLHAADKIEELECTADNLREENKRLKDALDAALRITARAVV
jgi:hypothetical protein